MHRSSTGSSANTCSLERHTERDGAPLELDLAENPADRDPDPELEPVRRRFRPRNAATSSVARCDRAAAASSALSLTTADDADAITKSVTSAGRREASTAARVASSPGGSAAKRPMACCSGAQRSARSGEDEAAIACEIQKTHEDTR